MEESPLQKLARNQAAFDAVDLAAGRAIANGVCPGGSSVRPGMPPMPDAIARLPVDDRGYPVPWFVKWIDGKPEFRSMDARKLMLAIKQKNCWVCGETLPPWPGPFTFVIGPMCSVNRVSSEPPSHHDCAVFSVKACPFLSKPHMERRENDMPVGPAHSAGVMITRNPGVTCLWESPTYQAFEVHNGILFNIGEAARATWWREGRPATRAEVDAAFDAGYPALLEMARNGTNSTKSVAELEARRLAALKYLPTPEERP